MTINQQLSSPGVWYFTDAMAASEAAEFASRLESLGYSALWTPEAVGRDPITHSGYLAQATTTLILATGIAGIHHRHPTTMARAAKTVAEQAPGRFILGLGVSHAPMVEGLLQLDYSRPLATMAAYLEAMDQSAYSAPEPPEAAPRVLAALGPKMLGLARDQADGAHPYWVTPEHTAQARQILGPDKLLCVEQKLILCTDPEQARAAAIGALGLYAGLPNYPNNWLRLGFTAAEIDARADRFVDALVGWGDETALHARVQEHYDAGADHVCIQPLNAAGVAAPDWNLLEALAPG
jgi:probable F420-dependent oxidoreductase